MENDKLEKRKLRTDHIVNILWAYRAGCDLQSRHLNTEDEWRNCDCPLFNFANFEYRIKHKPAYRPFKSKEEFNYYRERWLRKKTNANRIHQVLSFDDEFIVVECGLTNMVRITYAELLSDWVFNDDEPCGIKE